MVIYVLIFLVSQYLDHLFIFTGAGGRDLRYAAPDRTNSLAHIRSRRNSFFTRPPSSSSMLSVIPLGIIFLLTTNPSEFASSLNGVGVHYKAAYAFSLTLRYFPDVQRVYRRYQPGAAGARVGNDAAKQN